MRADQNISIIIVDDHKLVCRSLKKLLESFERFEVIHICHNGEELQQYAAQSNRTADVVLLDVNMPKLNGEKTMAWIKTELPAQKVIVLSMDDDESTIKTMLKHGARGYISKDIEPRLLKQAIESVVHSGFYYSDRINNILLNNLTQDTTSSAILSDAEQQFLKLVCTEKTYKEIASDMYLSPKTIDGYREKLFKKANVKSRTGLVLFAIKEGYVKI